MNPIRLSITLLLPIAFLATQLSALPTKQNVKFIEECEAFNLSAKCAPPKIIKPRTNFVKDEVVLMYSPDNHQVMSEVTKKYDLIPKSKEIFSSINTGVVVADTKGKNPLSLVRNISQKEKEVEAATNNLFQTAAIDTNISASNSYSMYETGVRQVQNTTLGKGVLICMVDTPVDIFHPTLGQSLIDTLDLIDFDPDNLESQIHGTAVAGILISQNKHIGIAPKAKLLAISAFGSSEAKPHFLEGTSAKIAKAIDRCIRQKADIINLSFTGGRDSLVEKVISKAINQGIIVVTAGGNGGHWGSTVYPALIPGVLTATAVDQNKKLYKLANRGRFVDFSAPGVNVLTIAPGGKYNLSTGTSLSSAHISGVIALLLSLNRSKEVSQILSQTALDLGKPGRDEEFGDGLVNAVDALRRLEK